MRQSVRTVVAIAAVVLGIVALVRGTGSPAVEAARGSAQIVRVVRRDLGPVVKATGVIRPRVGAEVRVGSRISGVVTRLHVQVGDAVVKGQPLAMLDDRDLAARRDEAAAMLRQAEVNHRYAAIDLRRTASLAASGNLSPRDLDLAERAAALAEQQVAAARAALTFAAAQVEYTRIIAPIAGLVASVSTQEGETVAASFAAPTFLTLLDPLRLEVWTYVDETDIGRIRIGQPARFTVDTYGDHEFTGRVTAVYPKAEIRDNVVNYVTVLRVDPSREHTLRPEMTTTVRIALYSRPQALAVPLRAVRREGGRAFVLLPRGSGVERRWVTTGTSDDSYWEVVDGLQEGDEILMGQVTTAGGGDR